MFRLNPQINAHLGTYAGIMEGSSLVFTEELSTGGNRDRKEWTI